MIVIDAESTSVAFASPVADSFGPLSGQLISAMKDTCPRAFLAQPLRLMMAMYSCQIQSTLCRIGSTRRLRFIGRNERRIVDFRH